MPEQQHGKFHTDDVCAHAKSVEYTYFVYFAWICKSIKMAHIHRELKTYDLKNCVSRLYPMFKLQNLHDDQFNALLNFLRGQDVFVNKSTGSGKSIIYQIALFAEMALAHRHGENTVWRSKAILLIICPLTSLMKDRVNYLQKLNINAAYVASSI